MLGSRATGLLRAGSPQGAPRLTHHPGLLLTNHPGLYPAYSPPLNPSAISPTTLEGEGSAATFTSIGILWPFQVWLTSRMPCQIAAKVWPISVGCFVVSKPRDFATQKGGSLSTPTEPYTAFTSS